LLEDNEHRMIRNRTGLIRAVELPYKLLISGIQMNDLPKNTPATFVDVNRYAVVAYCLAVTTASFVYALFIETTSNFGLAFVVGWIVVFLIAFFPFFVSVAVAHTLKVSHWSYFVGGASITSALICLLFEQEKYYFRHCPSYLISGALAGLVCWLYLRRKNAIRNTYNPFINNQSSEAAKRPSENTKNKSSVLELPTKWDEDAGVGKRKWPIKMGIAVILLLSIAIGLNVSNKPELFSSKSSPNGQWIAENYGYLHDDGGGYIVIRRSNGIQLLPNKLLVSSSTMPELYFIWKDDNHLTIANGNSAGALTGPSELKDIHIAYSTYPDPSNDDTFIKSNSIRHEIAPENITATFSEVKDEHVNGDFCIIVLNAVDGSVYDKVGMTVKGIRNVGVSREHNESKWHSEYFDTEFRLGQRIDKAYGKLLTSSTVSYIRPYNRLPKGDGHIIVRGQFIGDAAYMLSEEMQKNSFDLDYSINFSDEVISYRIPTQSISKPIGEFISCMSEH
jgi:hypothetical protein